MLYKAIQTFESVEKISAIPAHLPWQVFDKAFFYGWGLSADHNFSFSLLFEIK